MERFAVISDTDLVLSNLLHTSEPAARFYYFFWGGGGLAAGVDSYEASCTSR